MTGDARPVRQPVFLVGGRLRGEKILPLLERCSVVRVTGVVDLLRLKLEGEHRDGIVLVDGFGRLALLALLAEVALRCPLAVRIRGDTPREMRSEAARSETLVERWRLLLSRRLTQLVLKRAGLVVYNSRYARSRITGHVSDSAIERVVHNPYTPPASGSGCEPAEMDRGELRLLTVTNMDFAEKLFPTLEAVVAWMPDDYWDGYDIRWSIVGEGKHMSAAREAISEANLSHRVRLTGWVDNPGDYYSWCDVYVHVTRLDNFPNATMEAMAARKPVITNEHSCGVREQVFDGVNGRVVDGAEGFAAAIAEYVSRPDLRDAHGAAGAGMVRERWSVEAVRESMEEALDALRREGDDGGT